MRYPQLAPMTDKTIRAAVKEFCEEDELHMARSAQNIAQNFLHSPVATAKYGPFPLWEVMDVTDFSFLSYLQRDRLQLPGNAHLDYDQRDGDAYGVCGCCGYCEEVVASCDGCAINQLCNDCASTEEEQQDGTLCPSCMEGPLADGGLLGSDDD